MAKTRGRPRSISSADVPVAREALVAAHEILRHIHRPHRLRSCAIAARYLSLHLHNFNDDQYWIQSVEDFVRAALVEVPPRARIVVERMALDDEPVSAVSISLGISARQVYRDRAVAIDALARRLAATNRKFQVECATVHCPFGPQLAYVATLEQVGQLDAAEGILSRLSFELTTPRDRALVRSHLARLLFEQGRRKEALVSAKRALAESAAADDDQLARSEAESVIAEIALSDGEMTSALLMLRRSAVGFKSLLPSSDREHAGASLVHTLIMQSQADIVCGRFRKACEAATEAQRRFQELRRPGLPLQLAGRVAQSAAAMFLGADQNAGEAEMRTCYEAALAHGFIMSAVDVAVYLAVIYRFRHEESRATELFSSLLPLVRGISTSRTKAMFFLAFANALSQNQQGGLAMQMLLEGARATLPDQPVLEAQLRLTRARVRLADGANSETVEAAEEAALLFSRLGRPGLVGVSRFIESRAFNRMHRVREAVRAGRKSVDALVVAGHPQMLKTARDSLRRLTRSSSGAS